MRRAGFQNGECERERRALDWQRAAAAALLPALVAVPLAAASNPSWDKGDLLVGSYFALTSVAIYLQSLRVRLGRSGPTRAGSLAVLAGLSLASGVALIALDIASGGRL